MISTNINLASLKHVIQTKKGQSGDIECIVIPIAANNLLRTEKGNVFLNLSGFEIKNKKEGQKDTHIIKQNLPKEVYEKMSEEQRNAMPIIGNHVVWSDGKSEPSPNNAAPGGVVLRESDDLPF